MARCIPAWALQRPPSLCRPFSLPPISSSPSSVLDLVCKSEGRTRLDRYLAERVPETTRSQICHSIRDGFVEVNGLPCTKPSFAVRQGDAISFRTHQRLPADILPEAIPLNVVYEDDVLMVIDKAAGMVVHPSVGHWTGTLVNALMHRASCSPMPRDSRPLTLESPSPEGETGVFRPGIVHRLDMGTSGLLVVAKSDWVLHLLQEKFRTREIDRRYLALMVGCPKQKKGRIETNIDRDARDRKLQKCLPFLSSSGRTAVSNYTVLSTRPISLPRPKSKRENVTEIGKECLEDGQLRPWSLVSWELETGRTHQIRVHAKHLGCPIMGDPAYGGDYKRFLSQFRSPKRATASLEASGFVFPERPLLHAHTLSFTHPLTDRPLHCVSPLPDDFLSVLRGVVEADLPALKQCC